MMPQPYYRLDGKEVVTCKAEEWSKWFGNADRRVALTKFDSGHCISTVFLGLNHNLRNGPPLLFETMGFAPEGADWDDIGISRCSTWQQAEAQHAGAVAMAEGLLLPDYAAKGPDHD